MTVAYGKIQNAILQWFQGSLTASELVRESRSLGIIMQLEPGDSVLGAFEDALRNLSEAHYWKWSDYFEYAEDTAPTIKGLVHNLWEVTSKSQSVEEFLDWACWHNIYGTTTSGQFENSSIEYFCLIFLPARLEALKAKPFSDFIPLIQASSEISYGRFVIALHLHIESEERSMRHFFQDLLSGTPTSMGLAEYLDKKFGFPLPQFRFDLSRFPYHDDVERLKGAEHASDELMRIMKF